MKCRCSICSEVWDRNACKVFMSFSGGFVSPLVSDDTNDEESTEIKVYDRSGPACPLVRFLEFDLLVLFVAPPVFDVDAWLSSGGKYSISSGTGSEFSPGDVQRRHFSGDRLPMGSFLRGSTPFVSACSSEVRENFLTACLALVQSVLC